MSAGEASTAGDPGAAGTAGAAEAAGAAVCAARTGRSEMPPGLRWVGRSPTFTADTIPEALRQRHATAPNSWARLVVTSGRLRFCDLETGNERWIEACQQAIIAPEAPHRVTTDGSVAFHLEFYRAAT